MTNEGRDSKVSCPYCQAKFKDSTELSKHVDSVHTGLRLLEGDTRNIEGYNGNRSVDQIATVAMLMLLLFANIFSLYLLGEQHTERATA